MLSVFIRSLLVLTTAVCASNPNQLRKLQRNYTPQGLTNSRFNQLANLSNIKYFNEVLDNILIPRVVGTKNHEAVFNYIKAELHKLGWAVDIDEFESDTPFGSLAFKNIIGSLNPNAERYLVLACHYDSKYFKNEVFVGAIDSAVPCAMMLNLAMVLKNELDSIKDRSDLSLRFIFFDGEEAFVKWGPQDSIYGAKHLASRYHKSRSLARTTGETVSELNRMDMLVLLDLIGHRDINFYNFFPQTSKWYTLMSDTEDRLRKLGFLKRMARYFVQLNFFNSNMEDDHIPFLKKNVPILHLIPVPFPREWHTPNDNRDIIDINTVEDLNKIFRIFVAEYLQIYLSDTAEDPPEKEL